MHTHTPETYIHTHTFKYTHTQPPETYIHTHTHTYKYIHTHTHTRNTHTHTHTQSSGAVWKSKWPSWVPVPNKPTVSVDVKQHFSNNTHSEEKLQANTLILPLVFFLPVQQEMLAVVRTPRLQGQTCGSVPPAPPCCPLPAQTHRVPASATVAHSLRNAFC